MCTRYVSPEAADIERLWHVGRHNPWRGPRKEVFPGYLAPFIRVSRDIAECLKREVTSLGPTRSSLIAKGMVWSPAHGDTAFTVPLFDEFMRRTMPGDWR